MEKTAYLVLENGAVFRGKSFGASGEVYGELVFHTGMTGYLEILTDLSYRGQIVVHTFPQIGNYGVIPADFESGEIGVSGYIVKHWCPDPSNFRSEGTIDEFLKERGVIALCGIDTRTLTKTLRENGVMNGVITTDPDGVDMEKLRNYRVGSVVADVTARNPELLPAEEGKKKVAVLDLGMKNSTKRSFLRRGCSLAIFPAGTAAEEILAAEPDGIFLTNGPGDPAENAETIKTIEALCKAGRPIFGIGLGHQLLALANGLSTQKLKTGHRGTNQPVRDCESGKVYITSQNHGYAVSTEGIDPAVARISYENINDRTCEGLDYCEIPAFSVQFQPEPGAAPQNTSFLFDRFVSMMEGRD